jgi:hypothetical protein
VVEEKRVRRVEKKGQGGRRKKSKVGGEKRAEWLEKKGQSGRRKKGIMDGEKG